MMLLCCYVEVLIFVLFLLWQAAKLSGDFYHCHHLTISPLQHFTIVTTSPSHHYNILPLSPPHHLTITTFYHCHHLTISPLQHFTIVTTSPSHHYNILPLSTSHHLTITTPFQPLSCLLRAASAAPPRFQTVVRRAAFCRTPLAHSVRICRPRNR